MPGDPPVGSVSATDATAYLLNQSGADGGVNCCQYTGKQDDVSADGDGQRAGAARDPVSS